MTILRNIHFRPWIPDSTIYKRRRISTQPDYKQSEIRRFLVLYYKMISQKANAHFCTAPCHNGIGESLKKENFAVKVISGWVTTWYTKRNGGSFMAEDLLIMVDTQDRPLGPCKKMQAHQSARLHRAFSIFLCCDGNMLGWSTNSFRSWENETNRISDISDGAKSGIWSHSPRNTWSSSYSLRPFENSAIYRNENNSFTREQIFNSSQSLRVTASPNVSPHRGWEQQAFAHRPPEWYLPAARRCRSQFAPWFLIAAPRVLDYLEQCGTERWCLVILWDDS